MLTGCVNFIFIESKLVELDSAECVSTHLMMNTPVNSY